MAKRVRATRARKSTRREMPRAKRKVVARSAGLPVSELAKLDDLRRELERASGPSSPLRWNADPDDVQRSVAQLVLTLVEFIRKLLERQSIRRMEGGQPTAPPTGDNRRGLVETGGK